MEQRNFERPLLTNLSSMTGQERQQQLHMENKKTSKPNIGLDFHLCPNGDQTHQYNHTHNAIKTLCSNESSVNLTKREVRQTITECLVPKLSYPLHLTSYTQKQSDAINSTIRATFLPLMRFNRHLPSAVLYGTCQWEGWNSQKPTHYKTRHKYHSC
jgi:hypothetical protein